MIWATYDIPNDSSSIGSLVLGITSVVESGTFETGIN